MKDCRSKIYTTAEMFDRISAFGEISTREVAPSRRKALTMLVWYMKKVKGFKISRERLHPDGTRNQEHVYRLEK